MKQLLKKAGEGFSITFPAMTFFTDIMPLLQFLGLIISIVVGVTIIRMNITKTELYVKQLKEKKEKRKEIPDDDE